ncbi:TAXI family TRAP transporter solute-binding subunit [Amycolatopsis dongchuanensis]|uniref:TAXI family TRAP transporter solute-binding subunit n=1 Tax=Amycolatopsis dongchuanensis TaxID=1070866 RepID=UPI0031F9484D
MDRHVTRRLVLGGLLAGALTGCGADFPPVALTLTTGSAGAVYHQLGVALSRAWATKLGIPAPTVLTSAGSVENLDRLLAGRADIGFSAADAASDRVRQPGGDRLRALARMHDDYIQVVVPAAGPVTRLADLRGRRVSVGPPDSGVQLVADRLLDAAGLDVQRARLPVGDAAAALARGEIDAFFWSGGVPTEQVADLAKHTPIRLLDLSGVFPALTARHPEYGLVTLPASSYGLPAPVTTVLLPNFLLVTDRMPDEVAHGLAQGIFDAQAQLAAANPSARSLDLRSAIETVPVPLHPGALAYYRSAHYAG